MRMIDTFFWMQQRKIDMASDKLLESY